jgi:hypothetical protein
MDIQTKDYIDVEGQSKDGVIITCDGNSKKIAPSPLSIGVYGNTPINTISGNWKHVFFLNHNCEIRNLTIVAKSCKYAVHQDFDGDYESSINNCKLIADIDTYRCIGIGSRAGQYQRFKDLDLVMESKTVEAIGWHNYGPTVGVKRGSGMEAVNCRSSYKFIDVADLGSEREDIVRLVNCSSLNPSSADIVFTASLGFWPDQSNPATDKLLLPYNILVVRENTNLSVGQILRPNFRVF